MSSPHTNYEQRYKLLPNLAVPVVVQLGQPQNNRCMTPLKYKAPFGWWYSDGINYDYKQIRFCFVLGGDRASRSFTAAVLR